MIKITNIAQNLTPIQRPETDKKSLHFVLGHEWYTGKYKTEDRSVLSVFAHDLTIGKKPKFLFIAKFRIRIQQVFS
ncbi:MAG: hypothetical protein IPH57_00160 [Saprospiraceae bacterium]|nr:hypothetical protein [Saprospiraceae bacterium]